MKTLTTTLTTIALIALFIVVVTKIHLPKENNNQSATALTATEIKAKIADLKAQLTTTPTLTTYTRNLTIGSKGTDVLALQKYLKANGYLTIATPTTYFGTLTRAALAKWQKARNISPPAGYFGTISRAALNTSPTNNNTAIQLQIDALNQQLAAIPTTTTTTTTTVRTDFTPPTLSAGIPTGTLSSSTSSTTLGITTNEASTCKFSQNFNPYESMESTFEVTGGTTHTSTISNLSNGHSYTFHVECKDTAGTVTPNDYTISFSVDGVALGTGGSPIVTSSNTVDTTPPVRSAGSPGGTLNAGTTQTTLSLTTNEVATCKYATTSIPYLSMTSFTNTVSTTHTTIITGLTNSASYTYYVRCKDTANNTNTDDFNISFSVAAQGTPPDNTAPTVSITAPTGGTQSGTITVTATASDNIGVLGVQFLLDGSALQSEDTSSPYSISFNTTTTTNAVHTLSATARDLASNMTTSSLISITVNNVVADTTAPTILTSGPTGSLASSTTSTSLTVTTDENATCKYDTTAGTAYASMTNSFSPVNSTSQSATVSVSSGNSYSYYVRCSDASNNVSSQTTISFSVASSQGGGGGGSGALWYDDFQSYTSLSQITHATVNHNAWVPAVGEFFYGSSGHILYESNSTGQMTFDSTGGPSGGKVLTYHWPIRGTGSYVLNLGPYFTSFPQTSQIWIKWKDKLSNNFAPGGAGCQGASCEYKFLLLSTNNGGAIQMELENGNALDPDNNMGVRIKQLGIQSAVSDGSPNSGDIMDYKPAAGALVNQWNTWAIGITGIGTTSTQTKVYLNGTAILTLPAKNWLGSGVYPSSYFSLEMGANINNGPAQTQTRSWAEIGVYTSQPSLQ